MKLYIIIRWIIKWVCYIEFNTIAGWIISIAIMIAPFISPKMNDSKFSLKLMFVLFGLFLAFASSFGIGKWDRCRQDSYERRKISMRRKANC
jgi:hypothetical protein